MQCEEFSGYSTYMYICIFIFHVHLSFKKTLYKPPHLLKKNRVKTATVYQHFRAKWLWSIGFLQQMQWEHLLSGRVEFS